MAPVGKEAATGDDGNVWERLVRGDLMVRCAGGGVGLRFACWDFRGEVGESSPVSNKGIGFYGRINAGNRKRVGCSRRTSLAANLAAKMKTFSDPLKEDRSLTYPVAAAAASETHALSRVPYLERLSCLSNF